MPHSGKNAPAHGRNLPLTVSDPDLANVRTCCPAQDQWAHRIPPARPRAKMQRDRCTCPSRRQPLPGRTGGPDGSQRLRGLRTSGPSGPASRCAAGGRLRRRACGPVRSSGPAVRTPKFPDAGGQDRHATPLVDFLSVCLTVFESLQRKKSWAL